MRVMNLGTNQGSSACTLILYKVYPSYLEKESYCNQGNFQLI